MTILGPLLMVGLLMVPIYLAKESQEERMIALNQQDEYFLEDTEYLHFTIIPEYEAEKLTSNFTESPYYALLYIKEGSFTLYSDQQISLSVSETIEREIEKIIDYLFHKHRHPFYYPRHQL